MHRKLLTAAALALALTASANAQSGGTSWDRVAVEGEEFAVMMPGRPVKVARMLTFGAGTTLTPASYEAASNRVRYAVLSVSKARRGLTFAALIKGLRHALSAAEGGDYVIDYERDLTLDGRRGQQFSLRSGRPLGTVRVYSGVSHFYVLMSVGGAVGVPEVDAFFDSFTLAPRGRATAERLRLRYTGGADAPPSFWPAVPVAKPLGVTLGNTSPEPSAPRPDRPITGGVLNGKVISGPAPAYPAIARAARASGMVVVQILVDEGGRVVSASAVSGHPLLQQAAVSTVRQWRFSPTLLEGHPVKVTGTVTVNFVLE